MRHPPPPPSPSVAAQPATLSRSAASFALESIQITFVMAVTLGPSRPQYLAALVTVTTQSSTL